MPTSGRTGKARGLPYYVTAAVHFHLPLPFEALVYLLARETGWTLSYIETLDMFQVLELWAVYRHYDAAMQAIARE